MIRTPAIPSERRRRPWLALVAAFAFLAAGFIAAEHHHHELNPSDRDAGCAACTLAHAPSIAAETVALPTPALRPAGLAPSAPAAAPAPAPARDAAPRGPPAA